MHLTINNKQVSYTIKDKDIWFTYDELRDKLGLQIDVSDDYKLSRTELLTLIGTNTIIDDLDISRELLSKVTDYSNLTDRCPLVKPLACYHLPDNTPASDYGIITDYAKYDKDNVVYLIDIGMVDTLRLIKFGITSKLSTRIVSHKKTYGNTISLLRVFPMKSKKHTARAEKLFKAHMINLGHHNNIYHNNTMHTELVQATADNSIKNVIDYMTNLTSEVNEESIADIEPVKVTPEVTTYNSVPSAPKSTNELIAAILVSLESLHKQHNAIDISLTIKLPSTDFNYKYKHGEV